ncbi:MAG: hypothetical protein HKL83_09655 [Acidimicrobiaceae bacterium]|nr:hypothetical protein [Acidimicrobiaceae bacterium]
MWITSPYTKTTFAEALPVLASSISPLSESPQEIGPLVYQNFLVRISTFSYVDDLPALKDGALSPRNGSGSNRSCSSWLTIDRAM